MAWLQFIIDTPNPAQAEMISDYLSELGACAVTQAASNNEEIFEPTLNTTPLWENTRIEALFLEDQNQEELIELLFKQIPEAKLYPHRFAHLKDEAWERTCLMDFAAMDFGNGLWICPSWIEPPDPTACNIILDPGLAFGTGTHPTTRLCLEWIARTPLQNKTVLDYGCGSGILAIAAKLRGANPVYAVDIDEQAITATKANCERNHINKNDLHAMLTNEFPAITADVIVANILAQPLIDLAPTLASYHKPGGLLALSGILSEQSKSVLAAYSSWYDLDTPVTLGEWTIISGNRR